MNKITKYRTLIVDDEKYARNDLKELLSEYPFIEIAGEAKNINLAVKAIEELNPDIIFLDIQFPGETGFELFEKAKIHAKVIFVTAYNEYAIRAFEVNACDYLLKPVNPERLAITMNRLQSGIEENKTKKRIFANDDMIYLQLNYKYYFVKIDTIIIIKAHDHFTEIATSKGLKGLTNRALFEWKGSLPEDTFIQVHRSVIININFIEEIERKSHNMIQLKIKGIEKPVVVSRRNLLEIKRIFSFE